MKKGLIVLSLFDGGSMGQQALKDLGYKIDKYYASEIEKNAIKIAMKNHPNTIQIGDITKVRYEDGILYTENGEFEVGKIDLLIGGSPCQGFSIQGKKLNLDDPRSKLFFEYERILNEVNPTYFLLENVKMKKESENVITERLNVKPILINSSLLSAQNRDRLYWTNVKCVEQPNDLNLKLKDVVQNYNEVNNKYWYKQSFDFHGEDKSVCATLHINGHDILKRVNSLEGKSHTLTVVGGGNQQKKVYQNGRCRKLTPLEYERLQTLPDGYTEGVSDTARYSICGNGWTVSVIKHILKNMRF